MNITNTVLNNQEDMKALKLFFIYLKNKKRTSTLIEAMEIDYVQLVVEEKAKKIRQLVKEMHELVRETFSIEQKNDFNQLLVAEGLSGIELFSMGKILKLIEKNEIKKINEYKLLLEFVEQNFNNKKHISLIRQINELLNKFDKNE